MNVKLKPCPFCGGIASKEWRRSKGKKYGSYYYIALIVCDVCGASTRAVNIPMDCTDDNDEPNFDSTPFYTAALLWNNRPTSHENEGDNVG